MAGFKTHISTSVAVGVGYGAVGAYAGIRLETCMVASGICGLAGILPDLDSDSGVPVRETIAFVAAVIPMLMVDRFRQLGLSNESLVLTAGLIYLFIRFGVGDVFKRYTVHRGMWHSIPAAATIGFLAYIICSTGDHPLRLYKSGAAVLGFMTHLVLDELWSIEVYRGRVRLKKSFGTALKLWSKRPWANVSTYGKLVLFASLAFGDPIMMDKLGKGKEGFPKTARNLVDDVLGQGENLTR